MTLDPLAQINLVAIVAMVVIFLVTWTLLRRIFFLPLIQVMERRAARIETARTRKAEAEAQLSKARAEAERMVAAAADEATALRSGALARAGAEAEAILTQGNAEILALKQAQETRLAEELRACVTQTLARMIASVDETAVRYLVNRVLTAQEAR